MRAKVFGLWELPLAAQAAVEPLAVIQRLAVGPCVLLGAQRFMASAVVCTNGIGPLMLIDDGGYTQRYGALRATLWGKLVRVSVH